jgi:hypothetical protein
LSGQKQTQQGGANAVEHSHHSGIPNCAKETISE